MLELGVERAALRSVLRGVSNQRLFMDAQGKRTGIYECLDENGIAYWFEKQSLPEGFKDIETKIAEAASGGLKLL
jgi:type II secretory ATPase GspE/PulE/Tfp pilus assembly ATPase PilB-like protein